MPIKHGVYHYLVSINNIKDNKRYRFTEYVRKLQFEDEFSNKNPNLQFEVLNYPQPLTTWLGVKSDVYVGITNLPHPERIIAYWTFDKNEPTTNTHIEVYQKVDFQDSSTLGHHGIIKSGASALSYTLTENGLDTAWDADGTTTLKVLDSVDKSKLNINDNFTLFIRVYVRGSGGFVYGTYDSVSKEGYGITISNTDVIFNGVSDVTFSNALTNNAWNRIIITISNGTATLYVNGVKKGSSSVTITKPASPKFEIGPNNNIIDDLVIWDTVLNEGDIKYISELEKPRARLYFSGIIKSIDRKVITQKALNVVENRVYTLTCSAYLGEAMSRFPISYTTDANTTIDDIVNDLLSKFIVDRKTGKSFIDYKGNVFTSSTTDPVEFGAKTVANILYDLGTKYAKQDIAGIRLLPDGKFEFIPINNTPLFTLDLANIDLPQHYQLKLTYPEVEKAIVVGKSIDIIDAKQTTIPDKVTLTKSYAIKYQPTSGWISGFALPIRRIGNPTTNVYISLVGDNNGSPDLSVDPVIPAIPLEPNQVRSKIPTSEGDFLNVSLPDRTDVEIGRTYWWVIQYTGDATNGYELYGRTITPTGNTKESSDNITWTDSTFEFGYKIFTKKAVIDNVYNTLATEFNPKIQSETYIVNDEIEDVTTARSYGLSIIKQNELISYTLELTIPIDELPILPYSGDSVQIIISDEGINKSFTIRNMNWNIEVNGTTSIQMTLTASPLPPTTEDILTNLDERLRRQEFKRLVGSARVVGQLTTLGNIIAKTNVGHNLDLTTLEYLWDDILFYIPFQNNYQSLTSLDPILDVPPLTFTTGIRKPNTTAAIFTNTTKLHISNNPSYEISNFSFSFWINPSSGITSDMPIISKDSYKITLLSTYKIKFEVEGQTVISNTTLSTNTWYHIVCVADYTNNLLKIYINNSLDNSTSYTTAPTYPINDDLILGNPTATKTCAGYQLDGVSPYSSKCVFILDSSALDI